MRASGRWGFTGGDTQAVTPLPDDAHVPNDRSPANPDFADWVSAGRTRNFLQEDPILDWLDRFGSEAGFTRDDELPGFDPRTDLRAFLFGQGRRFEDGVLRLIGERFPITTIAIDVAAHSQSPEHAAATVEAMRAGAPVIAQAVLHDPTTRTYGVADLLVRSDVLDQLFPGTLGDLARAPAPALGTVRHHYRVVDVKFHTFEVTADGGATARDALPYMAQVWVYNEALGRLQGYTPPAAFLLGRSWRGGEARGTGCFERLARVDRDAIGEWRTQRPLADMVAEAVAWIRRVRAEGAGWQVLPVPTVPELYPNMKSRRDAPWHAAKARIADELAELTMLPAANARVRAAAHARGLTRWTDPGVSGASLGVWDKYEANCDAVLAANLDPHATVLPNPIPGDEGGWRTPATLELYVDFETMSNLNDDFSALPAVGGQSLIFQVGAGHWEGDRWVFAQWTADRLTEDAEATVIEGFVGHVDQLRRARGLGWDQVRLIHWWAHETSTYETAWDSAQARHPGRAWPVLPWFDFLTRVVRPAPLGVRGAFSNSLKPIAKSMRALGLIETTWDEGPGDGMGALVGAAWCDAEAARTGGSMRDLDVMAGIERYNEVDCRAMAEIVRWLRANR